MSNINWKFWQDKFKLLVDRGDGTHAERVEAYPPVKLMTDGDGDHARLRVDVGQTGFWAGKEFRTFYEFSITSGAQMVIRATVPVNIILFDTRLTIDQSKLRLDLMAGGTEGGTWTSVPVFRKNNMSTTPVFTPNVQIHTGGTHTGGVRIDCARMVSSGVGHTAITVGGQISDERGVSPGTYYYVFNNIDGVTATGVFSAFWEERV